MAFCDNGASGSGSACDLRQLLRARRDARIEEFKDIRRAAAGLDVPQTNKPSSSAPEDEQSTLTVQEMMEENERIGTVRKDNMFSEEITENEIDIIQQRVALQQKQFAEFERRELNRKANKVRQTFDFVSDEEVACALKQLDNDEDEVVLNLSQPGFLHMVRKEITSQAIGIKQSKPQAAMSAEERQKYEQLLRKRTSVMRKNVSDETRRKYQKVGRLRLEDALKQMRDDPDAAMEGWSEARKKAWKAIDKNPNSYYYRFNAPNEEQRTGQWTPHEQKLFHERLAELGANGQWGVFSMTIPGRVGYQCSNYYRQLVETNQIQDSNYVLDEKGKAHYLFSTKDGRKTFRTHCKHRRDGTSGPVGRSRRRKASEDEDENEYENGGEPDVTTADLSSEPVVKSKAKIKAEETADALPTAAAKRPRRRRVKRASDDYGSSNDSDDDWMHGRERDGDASGDYRSSAGGYGTTKRARAMNSRRAAAALTETSMNVDISSDARLCSSPIASPTSEDVASGMHNIALSDVIVNSGGGRVANGSINPLPGYIDPITLEEVIKPAISPFGHVMGYDNWVRCLTRSEPRNVCPITKNPLSKRDLVVLTPDNIEDYRARIISM